MTKVWFITGCSKGLGRALTEELLRNTDANVVATARDPHTLDSLKTEFPERLLTLKLDVTQTDEIMAAVQDALKTFGRIDVLVNNAGYGLIGALEECSPEEIRALFDTNVFGLMEVTRAVLPLFRAQSSGHILNISSVAGLVGTPGSGMYNSTKFAVEGFSESLALDVEDFGIKVTLIEPGPFRTDFSGGSLHIPSPLPAYDLSKAHKMRTYIRDVHHKQAGDPAKAAKAMVALTELTNPPLRLPLGAIAFDRIEAKIDHLQRELKAHETLGRPTDFEV